MDYDDILYFDWESGDDITLNLNYNSADFLWYTIVRGPVIFTFGKKLEIQYRNFLLQIIPQGVTIFSDYKPRTFGKKPPESLTSFNFPDLEDANIIWRGIEKLLETYPNKKVGMKSFEFDPSVLREK